MRPSFMCPSLGFSLVEMLVTLAILLVVLVVVSQFMGEIERAWAASAQDPFAPAQDAFDSIARQLATATLAPYPDYADAGGNFRTGGAFTPDHVARRSDLAFVCGPGSALLAGRATAGSAVFFLTPGGYTQAYAHQGLGSLFNAAGFFVEFGDASDLPAFLGAHRLRWRLKQVAQPSESLQIFATGTSAQWLAQLVPAGAAPPTLAENVLLLAAVPELAAGDGNPAFPPSYSYDSRDTTNRLTLHQLPPRMRLALVAIDEVSAAQLAAQNGPAAPALVPAGLFTQAVQLDADLATLDAALTAQKINHRIYQREISLLAASWSDTPSP